MFHRTTTITTTLLPSSLTEHSPVNYLSGLSHQLFTVTVLSIICWDCPINYLPGLSLQLFVGTVRSIICQDCPVNYLPDCPINYLPGLSRQFFARTVPSIFCQDCPVNYLPELSCQIAFPETKYGKIYDYIQSLLLPKFVHGFLDMGCQYRPPPNQSPVISGFATL